MLGDVFQYLAEIGKFLGPVFLIGSVQIFDERLHAVQTSFVQRLKNVKRREQKRAGAAGRVENGDVDDRVPQGAEQIGTFAIFYYVLGKLADVEVERYQVVDVVDFAAGQFGPDFLVAFAASNNLAPDFSGQSDFRWRGLVPARPL